MSIHNENDIRDIRNDARRRSIRNRRRRAKRGPQPHLARPSSDDLEDLHHLFADPRTWWNTPNHRHTSIGQTQAMLERWQAQWDRDGIGFWVARDASGGFLGAGGISRRGGSWNLRYCVAPEHWHHGYATYMARCGLKAAAHFDGTAPVFISSLSRNIASCLIADKLDFVVVRHDFDLTAHAASRRLYADRPVLQRDISDYLCHR